MPYVPATSTQDITLVQALRRVARKVIVVWGPTARLVGAVTSSLRKAEKICHEFGPANNPLCYVAVGFSVFLVERAGGKPWGS